MHLFSARPFEWSLRSGWRSSAFLLAIGLPALFVGAEAMRIGAAETFTQSSDLTELHWALALDPANPAIHKLAGLYFCYLETPDLGEGLKHLHRATELCPEGNDYWYTLASACELGGDKDCADQAFSRAVRLGPMVPHIEWAAANHYLATDRTDEALAHFKRLLKLDPGYDWPAFRICLRATGDPDLVFQRVVLPGEDTRTELSFIDFLTAQGEADFAYRIWVKTVASGPAFPFSSVEPYVERLISLGRGEEARNVWSDLERLGVVAKPETDDRENLVVNGDFERPPLNAGLDWRFRDIPYLSVNFSDPEAYHGKQCLALDFNVSRNDDFVAAFQFVPVAPNQEYLLKAYARSQDVASDSGPRLHVVDPSCPTCVDVLSETTVGTTPWHEVSLRFVTGPQARIVNLSVVRLRSRTFPTEITGKFWLDDVSMKAVSSAGEKAGTSPAP